MTHKSIESLFLGSETILPSVKPMFDDIRTKAQHLLRGSSIYDWVITEQKCDGFIVELSDIWSGDPGRGRWLCNDTIDCQGTLWKAGQSMFDFNGITLGQATHIHSFEWLRDLKALGGDMGRSRARQLLVEWVRKYSKWHPFAWRNDVLAMRISNWIKLYSFFGASADEHFQHGFFLALTKQFRHLANNIPETHDSLKDLQVLAALVYGCLTLRGQEQKLEKIISNLEHALSKLILVDGGFITRSPEDLIQACMIMLDLKTAMNEAEYPIPPYIEHALDRAIPAIRFFRQDDGKMSLFHATQEGDDAVLNMIMKRSGLRGKTWKSLPASGFERVQQDKTLLIFDTGAPCLGDNTEHLHASPLSFCFSEGKDRILTNCGMHPINDDWNYALRSTPAHNTLTIDHRNAFEIKNNKHIGRVSTINEWQREDNDDSSLITASHDGYYTLNGLTHTRRLYLGSHGRDLRGEDVLSQSIQAIETLSEHHVTIRFHLHPSVNATLINAGSEALLKTKSGKGWRFFARGIENFKLEESVYFGKGCTPRKTLQIVLETRFVGHEKSVKWALQREGV